MSDAETFEFGPQPIPTPCSVEGIMDQQEAGGAMHRAYVSVSGARVPATAASSSLDIVPRPGPPRNLAQRVQFVIGLRM